MSHQLVISCLTMSRQGSLRAVLWTIPNCTAGMYANSTAVHTSTQLPLGTLTKAPITGMGLGLAFRSGGSALGARSQPLAPLTESTNFCGFPPHGHSGEPRYTKSSIYYPKGFVEYNWHACPVCESGPPVLCGLLVRFLCVWLRALVHRSNYVPC